MFALCYVYFIAANPVCYKHTSSCTNIAVVCIYIYTVYVASYVLSCERVLPCLPPGLLARHYMRADYVRVR